VFLSTNTTSLLQSLDQGIISTFKALYIKKSFRYILDHVENEETISIIDVWKNLTMLDCIKNISMTYYRDKNKIDVIVGQSRLHNTHQSFGLIDKLFFILE
ncbi:hypothetical protein, partial [Hydrotalea sp.]|uniref:hypothetical protein n=1 Tax=Hydrotalea sp. TaxID=2881279 RepID=UPI003D0FFA52